MERVLKQILCELAVAHELRQKASEAGLATAEHFFGLSVLGLRTSRYRSRAADRHDLALGLTAHIYKVPQRGQV
jgi:hypothetical protein